MEEYTGVTCPGTLVARMTSTVLTEEALVVSHWGMLRDCFTQEITSTIILTEAIAAPGDAKIIMAGTITAEPTEPGTKVAAATGPTTTVAATTVTVTTGTTVAAMSVVAPALHLKEILRHRLVVDQGEIVIADKENPRLHGVEAQEATATVTGRQAVEEWSLAEVDKGNLLHHGVAQEVVATVTGRQEWSQAEEERTAARQEAARVDPRREPKGVRLPKAEPDVEAETKR